MRKQKENTALEKFFNDDKICNCEGRRRYRDMTVSYAAELCLDKSNNKKSTIILYAIKNDGKPEPTYSIALQGAYNEDVEEYGAAWGNDQTRINILASIVAHKINSEDRLYNQILSCDM